MLIPGLYDFKQYMGLLEAQMPDQAKYIHDTVVLVESDVREAIQADVAANDPDADKLTTYVTKLSEEFFKAMNRCDNKFGTQKFIHVKEDFGKTLGLLTDDISEAKPKMADVKRHVKTLIDIRNGIFDQNDARYWVGPEVVAQAFGLLGGLNDALGHLEEYVKVMAPEAPAAPAKKAAPRPEKKAAEPAAEVNPEDTAKYWFKYHTGVLTKENYPGVVVGYHGNPTQSKLVQSNINKALEDKVGEGIDEGNTYSCMHDTMSDGCYFVFQATDISNTEILKKIEEAVRTALGPRIKDAKIFAKTSEIDEDNTLATYRGGEYALDYQWVLRALGNPDDADLGTMAAVSGIPAHQAKSFLTGLVKQATDKINSMPFSQLTKINEGVISHWFVRQNKFTQFIASKLAPQLRDYLYNINVDTRYSGEERGGKEVGEKKSNSLWNSNRAVGAILAQAGSTDSYDDM